MSKRECGYVGTPAYTWKDYVFGTNIVAGCIQFFTAIAVFILTFGSFFYWLDH